jgi:threonylcarbamoyladenosine tRNA methylthiotransferase MtaB
MLFPKRKAPRRRPNRNPRPDNRVTFLERGEAAVSTVPRRVAFYTFGCKLNQCETAAIRARFDPGSWSAVPFEAAADVYVINTCSVTGRADAQARQLVRRVIRERPESKVVVTGCYAQRAPRELAAIPGVTLVAGNGEKDRLAELVERLEWDPTGSRTCSEGVVAVSDLRKTRRSFDLAAVEFGERTRAFLRVQDGCDAACSFCIIPHLRGRSTSLAVETAVARVRSLVERGYREIVLTGIHLGMFGHDRIAEGTTLAGLVRRIDELPGEFRIRLSSIEPQEIDEEIIGLMADPGSRLVPHLHVPLQSGCDITLKAMNRTYTAGEYRDVVERITRRVDTLGLGADVIVGFPGETDDHFEETARFIEELPFTYLHVFPYSPRPGTRAATLPGRPPGDVVEERGRILRETSDRKRRGFLDRMIGRTMTVLVEEPSGETAWEGWSEHYARVAFDTESGDDLTNRFMSVIGELRNAEVIQAVEVCQMQA